jgi:hypothetical protein
MDYCKCKKPDKVNNIYLDVYICNNCHKEIQTTKSKKLFQIAKKAVRGKDGRFVQAGKPKKVSYITTWSSTVETTTVLEQRVKDLEEESDRGYMKIIIKILIILGIVFYLSVMIIGPMLYLYLN